MPVATNLFYSYSTGLVNGEVKGDVNGVVYFRRSANELPSRE